MVYNCLIVTILFGKDVKWWNMIRNKYLVSPIHYEGLQRKEPLEIPEDGLSEMLCNSLIHKDYTGTFIQMKVFDDYITLWNGGTLPLGYTVEKLMEPHDFPYHKRISFFI